MLRLINNRDEDLMRGLIFLVCGCCQNSFQLDWGMGEEVHQKGE